MKAKILIALLTAFTLAGCVTAPPRADRADLLNFLADGKTTRGEVLTALGQPSGRFESGKVFTYRLGYEPKNNGCYVVEREGSPDGWPTWRLTTFSLVLASDDAGMLHKHSLVKVNK